MKRQIFKSSVQVVMIVILFFIAAIMLALHEISPSQVRAIYAMGYMAGNGIYIGVFSYWTISLYKRVMQSRVRTYLIFIGISIIFWITLRAVKWRALEFVIIEDRLFWYMYYIPMILMPLLFFFISLYVGQGEGYRPSKKWKLLYIPAVLLILLVLTNDLHRLAFDIDLDTHAIGLDYTHGVVYYLVCFFILFLVVMSIVLIVRKVKRGDKRLLIIPALVIVCSLIYTALYVITPSYGIGYYLDLTTFGCVMTVALLESFIMAGFIHSNIGHKECFSASDIRAQIIDENGDVAYISENALPVSRDNFMALEIEKQIYINRDTVSSIVKINSGYVVYNSDVSGMRKMIEKLNRINEKLHKEVDLLRLENEQKGESAKLEKLSDLHGIMIKEVLPFSKKIKLNISNTHGAKLDEVKKLLFETSMLSTYIKRKVNLILTQQTEKCISTAEMRRTFLESFQLLSMFDRSCAVNIIKEFDMSLDKAMLSYDLYQNVIEKTRYDFDTVYVTYDLTDEGIKFTLEISGDVSLSQTDIDMEKIRQENAKLEFMRETESYFILLIIPK